MKQNKIVFTKVFLFIEYIVQCAQRLRDGATGSLGTLRQGKDYKLHDVKICTINIFLKRMLSLVILEID